LHLCNTRAAAQPRLEYRPWHEDVGVFAAFGANPFFLHTRDQHHKTSVGYDYGKFIVVAICQCGLASNRGAAPLGEMNVIANKSRRGTYSRSTTRQFYHSGNAVEI
jgi:hypothetical protein